MVNILVKEFNKKGREREFVLGLEGGMSYCKKCRFILLI
jgi:hypothetical protein